MYGAELQGMESFGMKSMLRQTIIGSDSWFKDSQQMVNIDR